MSRFKFLTVLRRVVRRPTRICVQAVISLLTAARRNPPKRDALRIEGAARLTTGDEIKPLLRKIRADLERLRPDLAVLVLQGPGAPGVMARWFGPQDDWRTLPCVRVMTRLNREDIK